MNVKSESDVSIYGCSQSLPNRDRSVDAEANVIRDAAQWKFMIDQHSDEKWYINIYNEIKYFNGLAATAYLLCIFFSKIRNYEKNEFFAIFAIMHIMHLYIVHARCTQILVSFYVKSTSILHEI